MYTEFMYVTHIFSKISYIIYGLESLIIPDLVIIINKNHENILKEKILATEINFPSLCVS